MERRQHYVKKAKILDLLFRSFDSLGSLLSPDELRDLQTRMFLRQDIVFKSLQPLKLRKLQALCDKKQLLSNPDKPCNYPNRLLVKQPFASPVINLSTSHLNSPELQSLSYGNQFSLPPSKKVSTLRATFISDIATGIRYELLSRYTFVCSGPQFTFPPPEGARTVNM